MHLRSKLFVLCFGALICAPARADTLQSFNFSGDLVGYPTYVGTFVGTALIDTTDGTVVSGSFTVYDPANSQAPMVVINQLSRLITVYDPAVIAEFVTPNGQARFELAFPTTLVGYQGGPLCSVTAICLTYDGGHVTSQFIFGMLGSGVDTSTTSLSTSSETPEPSSLLLVGSGLLGLAGLARQKHASRSVTAF